MYKQVVFIGRDYKASHNWNLEKDKVYDVIHESTYNYYIKNPIGGGQFAFAKNNFITIQDYRDLKLKELVEQHPTNGRCKCIKTYVPSMQIESHQTYYTYIEDDKIASYVVNNRFILSPEIFNEHFVDVAIIRNEQLNLLV